MRKTSISLISFCILFSCQIMALDIVESAEEFYANRSSEQKFADYLNNTVLLPGGISLSKDKLDEIAEKTRPRDQKSLVVEIENSIFESKTIKYTTDIALASSLFYTLVEAEDDKKKHYLVGAVIGGTMTELAKIYFKGDEHQKIKSFLVGAGSAILAGVLKEVYDSKGHGTVDAMDAVYTAVPGALIALRFNIDI